jgi:uncharacterized membrane protein
MTERTPQRTLPAATLLLIACGAVFIWLTSQSLPPLVAAHFDSAGRTNAYMPRGRYIALLLGIAVIVPLFLVIVPRRTFSKARINLPNRDYWLAPERRDETFRFLARQTSVFAWLVVLFLCYVQWLVVRANALTPPSFDTAALVSGLLVFLVCTFSWLVRVIVRFR